jgi:hypothetical protein
VSGVLAWLDSLHATTADGAVTNCKWAEAQQARAVVVELIEAGREMRNHTNHHPDCSAAPNGVDGDCWCGFFGSAERLDAALADFRGEA